MALINPAALFGRALSAIVLGLLTEDAPGMRWAGASCIDVCYLSPHIVGDGALSTGCPPCSYMNSSDTPLLAEAVEVGGESVEIESIAPGAIIQGTVNEVTVLFRYQTLLPNPVLKIQIKSEMSHRPIKFDQHIDPNNFDLAVSITISLVDPQYLELTAMTLRAFIVPAETPLWGYRLSQTQARLTILERTSQTHPDNCIFPFDHGNRTFRDCSLSTDGRSWCPTKLTSSLEPVPGHWRWCDQPVDTPCSFPFLDDNRVHYACTSGARPRPWCATAVDETTLVPISWRWCDTFPSSSVPKYKNEHTKTSGYFG